MNRNRGPILILVVLLLAMLSILVFSFKLTPQFIANEPSPSGTQPRSPVPKPHTVTATLNLEPTNSASTTITPTLEATDVTSPIALTTLPEGNSAAASLLQVQHSCGASGVNVTFTWSPGQGQTGQVIDISIFNNNFQTGTFSSSELLSSEINSYLWEGLADGVTYVWRVRSQVGSVWAPSGTEFFTTTVCGADIVNP